MKKYAFHIVDVFTQSAFGGNQLGVLTDAAGLSPEGMQKIAREFNFAETTFVLPPQDPGNACRVRIFTPKAELPFAGHPTVGTACVLAIGGLHGAAQGKALILEEGIGPVTVHVENDAGVWNATLTLPGMVEERPVALSSQELAAVLSLEPRDVGGSFFAGAGLEFCFVQLASRDAVDRARLDKAAWTRHLAAARSPHIHLFAGELAGGATLYARMFAPALGIDEDPATGSAAAALVGAVAARPDFADGEFRLLIEQGVAMGRPSVINAAAHKANGALTAIRVGGATAHVAAGQIDVPATYLLSH